MILKRNIPGQAPIMPDENAIALGPLVLGVAGQHALQADADALDVLHGAPALAVEQVEADDAVAVDVRVHGHGPRRVGQRQEHDLGRLDRVVGWEAEAQAEGLRPVQWVAVQHADVHVPFFKVCGRDEGYAGGERGLELGGR